MYVFIRIVVWSYRIRLGKHLLVPHPIDDTFAMIGTSRAAHNINESFKAKYTTDSLAIVFGVKSSQPIRSYSVPFTLRHAVWYDTTSGPSTDDDDTPSSSYSLLAVTNEQTTVLIGDNIMLHAREGSAGREITTGAAEAFSRPTLFQDIFGKSAFANMEERGQGSNVEVSRSLPDLPLGTKSVDLSLLDGPAHLLPPISSLFDSLIGSFTSGPQGAKLESAVPNEVEDIIMVDAGETETSAQPNRVPQHHRARRIDESEMTLFTELFRTMLATPSSPLPPSQSPTKSKHMNGNGNGVSETNGKTNGHHHPVTNGKVPRVTSNALSTPSVSPVGKVLSSKNRKPAANGTPLRTAASTALSEESAAPSPTTGQKRKKSSA